MTSSPQKNSDHQSGIPNTVLQNGPRQLLFQHPAHFFSFGFGSGLARKAPGTFGSLAALPLLWLLWFCPFLVAVIAIIVGFAFGVWCTERTSKALFVHDPGSIVWDEFIGIFIASLPVWSLNPGLRDLLFFSVWSQLIGLLIIFGVFRFFDILKPFPVSWADQKFDGGFGIMFDDVLAGLLSAILIFGIVEFF